eukprot:8942543-Pyramimonas_sp.AAC.1
MGSPQEVRSGTQLRGHLERALAGRDAPVSERLPSLTLRGRARSAVGERATSSRPADENAEGERENSAALLR